MNKWVIKYWPRREDDPRPWFLGCPNTLDCWYSRSGCYCRRFKNGNAAISYFRRRVRGNRVIRGDVMTNTTDVTAPNGEYPRHKGENK